jgi:hypothetical protein
VHARGRMRVVRGTGVLARVVGRMLRLPPPSTGADLRLTIVSANGVERWTRTFDGLDVITEQRETAFGVIAERFGRLEFDFRVEPENGAQRYRQVAARLLLFGGVHVTLPLVFAPRIEGLERTNRPGSYSVQVRVTWPPAGLILQYDGDVHIEDHA